MSLKWFSSTPEGRLSRLFHQFDIDLVLDVGANRGQYVKMLRGDLDYTGKIVSFEPMHHEYDVLKKNFGTDTEWCGFNVGLGDECRKQTINIAGNSASSSLLSATSRLSEVAPQTISHGTEEVQVLTLDSIMDDIGITTHETYLKIDAQGYESKVLTGAKEALKHINTIQLEMALVPMYEGALSFHALMAQMMERDYRLIHMIPGLWDRNSGELLELDGIFHRISPIET